MLTSTRKKHKNDPQPANPGDLVRLTGLDWIGHNLMGKIGLVLSTSYSENTRCDVFDVLFENRIVKIIEDDLTILSRAHTGEHGTM